MLAAPLEATSLGNHPSRIAQFLGFLTETRMRRECLKTVLPNWAYDRPAGVVVARV